MIQDYAPDFGGQQLVESAALDIPLRNTSPLVQMSERFAGLRTSANTRGKGEVTEETSPMPFGKAAQLRTQTSFPPSSDLRLKQEAKSELINN